MSKIDKSAVISNESAIGENVNLSLELTYYNKCMSNGHTERRCA